MRDGSQALNLIYLFIILVAVISAFAVRRINISQTLKMVLAWVLIFGAMFAIFALRDDFRALGNRLWAAITGNDNQEVVGGELRIWLILITTGLVSILLSLFEATEDVAPLAYATLPFSIGLFVWRFDWDGARAKAE